MRPIKHLRWWIVWTLFCSTTINYIDRQTLSVLAPFIEITRHGQKVHLSDIEYSQIVFWFQIAYAVMWLVGGIIIDVIGTRLGLTVAMIWWSVSSMLPAGANTVMSFGIFRFMLGIGEGFNWPGASKTVAEWFPARERGLAVAIFDSGSSIGGFIAPSLVAFVAYTFGWRFAFLTSGALGFFWLILWLNIYRPLRTHPRLSAEERTLIEVGHGAPAETARVDVRRLLGLLKESNVWGIVLGRSFTDPIWWFYVFWIPKYLHDARHFDLKEIGMFAGIPLLASDLGNFTGGLVSGFLIKRGMPVVRARKWVCAVSCLPILAGVPAALTSSAYWAIALISLATWGYASWSTMGLTLPSDLFPQDVVASVTGLSGLGAAGLSAFSTLAVGWSVGRFSYVPVFVVAGTIPLLATACVLLLIHSPQTAKPS